MHTTEQVPPITVEEHRAILLDRYSGAGKYLDRFDGRKPFAVIKAGGWTIDNQLNETVEALVLIQNVGLDVALLHGGGTQIDKEIEKHGWKSEKPNGLRYTPPEHMPAVKDALDEVNDRICQEIRKHGGRVTGIKGPVFTAELENNDDLGSVDTITHTDTRPIRAALNEGFIPVVNCIAKALLPGCVELKPVNSNADKSGAALAIGLLEGISEEKRLLKYIGLTREGRIKDGDYELDDLPAYEIDERIRNGTISGGMIPKTQAAAEKIAAGVHDIVYTQGAWLTDEVFGEGRGSIIHQPYQN